MIYVLYILLVPVSLLLTIVSVLLAPILPIFRQNTFGWCDNHSYEDFGPHLPSWLNWLMTPDNDLYGDATFQRLNGKSYWSMVKWLWRNPAYSFALRYLNNPHYTIVRGDKTIRDNDNSKAGWCFIRANGLFQFVWIKPIGFSRCIYINLGWNVRALVDDNIPVKPDQYQATFAFSPRISGFR